jgi:N-acetylmuramoyl-L-alanine amidase
MVKLLGSRGAAAVGAFFLMLVGGSTEAFGQQAAVAQITPAVLGVPAIAAPQNLTLTFPNILAPVTDQEPVSSAVNSAATDIAKEASWLYSHGWGLSALVDKYSAGTALDEEANCLATAVYFEARGEALEGQLAVARVVMNRAASGKYPSTWCATVKQPWQFSFVRHGQFPTVNTESDAWHKAQAITRLAMSNVVPSLPNDVLWYHANYVAPSWGRRLTKVSQIGAHIFYRA